MAVLFYSYLLKRNVFGLKNKFRIIVTIALFLIFASTSYVLINNSKDSLTSQVTEQALAYADLTNKPLSNNYELYFSSGYAKFEQTFKNLLSLNKSITKIQIIDMNGFLLFDSTDLSLINPPEKRKIEDDLILSYANKQTPTNIYNQDNTQIKEIIYPSIDDWHGQRYAIRYFFSYDLVQENVERIRNIILLIAFVSLVTTILLVSKLINVSILNPLEKVSKGALLISQGNLAYEIKIRNKDEIGDLANAVNRMARSLQKDIESLRQVDKLKDEFIAIASHNLRTPLTAIKGYLGLIEKNDSGHLNTKQQEYIHTISTNITRLDGLVEDILSVVYYESGNTSLIKTPTDIVKLARDIVIFYKEEAVKKGITLDLIKPLRQIPLVEVDKTKINEVYRSLLDNAIKFTNSGGQIRIYFEINNQTIVTHVQDTGIGIVPEEMNNLFQKFHRATDILNYDYSGEGISLYISKLIINSHSGKIWADSKLGKGSTFSFSLPISPI